MKAFFKDIFQYHSYTNKLLLEEFKKGSVALPERSFRLYCHILNAHQIWNARILGQKSIGVNDMHSADECQVLDTANYELTISILDTRELSETVPYKTKAGQDFSNSIQDILFHAVNHGTHHRGQIISDFRQAGIEPPITDYIFYRR